MTTTRPVCANCGAQNCYTTKDGTVVCRTCGHREPARDQQPRSRGTG